MLNKIKTLRILKVLIKKRALESNELSIGQLPSLGSRNPAIEVANVLVIILIVATLTFAAGISGA